MTHQTQNITGYHAGDALDIVATVEDETGTVIDITNANAIEYLIKENASDSDTNALLTKTLSGGGVSITDGANGEFTVSIDTNDTGSMSGDKHHRARLTDSNGDRSTVFTGTISISV